MSDDNTSFGRREMLQKTAAAGAGSFGLLAAADVSAADFDDKQTALEEMGVVLTEERVHAHSDTVIPAEVRTGQRLLERLEADGLLESASLDALPAFDTSNDGKNFVELSNRSQREVGFTKTIPQGRLHVNFAENIVPMASLIPRDGGAIVNYISSDGQEYERVESSQTVSGFDDVTGQISDPMMSTNIGFSPDHCDFNSDCPACECTNNWCLASFHSWHCYECSDSSGTCVLLTKCGCP